MVIVDGRTTYETIEQIKEEIANEPTQEEIENQLLRDDEGEIVLADVVFTYPSKCRRFGFYLDSYLKSNFDDYVIKAVLKKWDAVILVTGIEGSAKSTSTFSFAKYVDPIFPGELIDEKTTRRHCDRIVFTADQFLKAVDDSKIGQAIVWDEAVLGFMAGDASSQIQKILVKKMVTIRKKRLYIFIVIPSIFLLRMYMAVFRTRACIHFYSPDGLDRGYFKFYSYDSKRQLYIKGKKEFNQGAHPCDFKGRTTNTEGLFFDVNEYDKKKDDAIKQITEKPKRDKENEKEELTLTNMKYKVQRNRVVAGLHRYWSIRDSTWDIKKTSERLVTLTEMKFTTSVIRKMIEDDEKQQIEEMKNKELAGKLKEKIYNNLEDIDK
jgi:hypothetical protein